MPQSFDGLGSPAFYFYPPLSFWLNGLVETVTFGALPASYRLAVSSLLLMWASEPLKDVPLTACTPAASICRAEPESFGALRIEVDNTVPTNVVLRRFVFPAWRLDGPMVIVPTNEYRLISFVVPAGHITVRLQRVTLPAEQWGLAISSLSLVLLLAAAAFSARRSTRKKATESIYIGP